MNFNYFLKLVVATLAVGAILFFLSWGVFNKEQEITNFEECALAGYPVIVSYPRQCVMPNGKKFVEDIGNELEKSNSETVKI